MRAVFLDFATLGATDLSLDPLTQLPVDWHNYATTERDMVSMRIADADIVVTNKVPLDAEAIAGSRRLKFICAAATGHDHIDVSAAHMAGIPVSNVRHYATAAVVQHVYALILAIATRLLENHDAVRSGRWADSDIFCLLDHPAEELDGKKLGIIGYGVLGRAVAGVAPAFGMKPLVARSMTGAEQSERLPLDELLTTCDIVSVHLPLSPATRDLLGPREFQLMPEHAWLINTSRGGVVDEQALAFALRTGQIAAAGIDVLATEPPARDSILLSRDIPGLIVTPHTAWASRQARQRLLQQIAANIKGFINGQPVNRVDV
jgi:glycerate dehydrogenase